jgi:iron(III) transport system substrate-binding protein
LNNREAEMTKSSTRHKLYLSGVVSAALVCMTAWSQADAADAESLYKKLENLTPAERHSQLVEGAKKEGKVVWYTTDAPRPTQIIFKAFNKKYPFVKPQFIRSKSRKILDRVLTESRAGKHLFDLAKTSTETFPLYPVEKTFARYSSSAKNEIPSSMKGERWTSLFTFIRAIGWNTEMLAEKDVPKTWEDLLDPKWKGKILFDQSSLPEVGVVYDNYGKEKGPALLDKLGSSGNLKLRRGRTQITQLLAAGDAPLAVTVYPYRVERMKKKGASIEWGLLNFTPGLLQPVSISRNAPHPYSAALLHDFLLSEAGQKVYARMGRLPANPKVEAKNPKLRTAIKDPRLKINRPDSAKGNAEVVLRLLDEKILKKSFKK